MRVHCYCICRNEEFVMPYFLRHYSTFCDRITVYDDQSTDRTREIVRAHPSAVLVDYPYSTGLDDLAFLELYTRSFRDDRGVADWSICVDADEFAYLPNMRSELERALSLGWDCVWSTGYVMVHPTLPTTSGQIYDEAYNGVRSGNYNKTVIVSPHSSLTWTPGRHHVHLNGSSRHSLGVKLLHYRYLSEDYTRVRTQTNLDRIRMSTEENQRVVVGNYGLSWRMRRAMRGYKRGLEIARRVVP